jgi:LuxR family maltose regulon positive regulatory protein
LPLVNVKLATPVPPLSAVGRPRLEERLEGAPGGSVTVVSGPTGAGKTALLASWSARPSSRRRSWVSFDPVDNDPIRFWSYAITALQRLDGRAGTDALAALPSSGADERVLTSLLRDLEALDVPSTIVLDDFQVVESQEVLDALTFLVERLPSTLQVVIATRSEPRLPMARLRLTGRLVEVRESHLRFRPDEAHELLDALGVRLDPADAALLVEHTEGWAAGLQLAGLSLREHPDPVAFVHRFAGSTRVVADLLVEEVLDRQAEDVRDFLLRTSVLERLSAPLCDAVARRDDSARILRQLEASNLFLIPLDDERQWFRYQQLFGELLRSELHAADPGAERDAHRTAGRWFVAQGHPPTAIKHHLAAGELDEAWEVVTTYYGSYFMTGRHSTVRDWVRSFPSEYLAAEPLRAIEAGMALVLAGAVEQAQQWIGVAEAGLPASTNGHRAQARLELLRGVCATWLGNLPAAVGPLDRAARLGGDRDWPVTSPLQLQLLRVRVDLQLGAVERARGLLDDLPPHGLPLEEALVLTSRAELALVEGALHEAETFAKQAWTILEELDQLSGALVCDLRYVRGVLLLERGELAAAEDELEAALAVAQRAGGAAAIVLQSAALARTRAATGRTAEAFSTLRRARERVGGRTAPEALSNELDAAESRLRLRTSGLKRAAELIGALPAGAERSRLLVRLDLARGRSAEARRRLSVLGPPATLRQRIEDALLAARAAMATDVEAALGHLRRAVALARPEAHSQVFLDEGPEIAALLRRLEVDGDPTGLHVLVEAVNAAPAAVHQLEPLGAGRLVESLSERELGVLHYLPSPLSYGEIAQELYISPNTLKTHMKNLYRKLEVGSRQEAVTRARALELL